MATLSKKEYEARASVRYAIRKFLRISERKAHRAGITPQQYQLLLAIKGMEDRDWATLTEIAERLQITHHSAIGLCSRAGKCGMVERFPHSEDLRQVCVRLTKKGEKVLNKIALETQSELDQMLDDILQTTNPKSADTKTQTKRKNLNGVKRSINIITQINIASPDFKANPYPFYRQLRDESPVSCVILPDKQPAWLITRYDDVVMTLKDDRFVKNILNAVTPAQIAKQPWFPALFKSFTENMLNLDEPNHTRLRALAQKAFTTRLVEKMQARVESLVNELLDRRIKMGHMDVIHDYAQVIPTNIIAEMLGVPISDQDKFHHWSNAIVSANSSSGGMVKGMLLVTDFIKYLGKLIKLRRARPQDDLLSALIAVAEAGEKLNEDELIVMIVLLLTAGYQTTVNLIGNGVLALLENPKEMDRLSSEPLLIKTAIEELLRYHSPLETATERFTREEISLNDVIIPRGELVYAVIASANRDERQFVNPDMLDISRDPNKHIAFGQGMHYCLGAPLARLEGRIAITTLLSRVPNLRLAVPNNSLKWRQGLVLRGLEKLPVLLK